jgi:hypothetical protein
MAETVSVDEVNGQGTRSSRDGPLRLDGRDHTNVGATLNIRSEITGTVV